MNKKICIDYNLELCNNCISINKYECIITLYKHYISSTKDTLTLQDLLDDDEEFAVCDNPNRDFRWLVILKIYNEPLYDKYTKAKLLK